MSEIFGYILNALEHSINKLSDEAGNVIKRFVISQMHPKGGFVDRAGKSDPYYSVFGYTLAFIFDLKPDINTERTFITNWINTHKLDFIHTVSILRCLALLYAIEYKWKLGVISKQLSKSNSLKKQFQNTISKKILHENPGLLDEVKEYQSKDKGYNHINKGAENGNIYATFLVWTLYQELGLPFDNQGFECIKKLQTKDGSYANESNSLSGVTTATSAGILMSVFQDNNVPGESIDWLKSMWNNHGGFVAAREVPVADLLSTSTALLALKISGEKIETFSNKCQEFINLHWDHSGGFFGSIADTIPDCEYTYYALLSLGLI